VGAIAGSRAGGNKLSKVGAVVAGALIGQQIGYKIAPHEKQARARAAQVKPSAVSRSLKSE